MSDDVLFYSQEQLIPDPARAARLLLTDSITRIVIVRDNAELRGLIPEEARFLPEVVIGEDVTSCHAFLGLKNLCEISSLNNKSHAAELDLHYLFRGCEKLTRIPHFFTGNVTSMRGMFANCRSLETIPELNTEKVTDFRIMFEHCSSLVYLPALRAQPGAEVYGMFSGCHRLEKSRLAEANPREYLDFLLSSQRNPHSIKDRQNLDAIDRVFSKLYSNYEENSEKPQDGDPAETLPVYRRSSDAPKTTDSKIKDLAENVSILRRKMDLHLQEKVESVDKRTSQIEQDIRRLEDKIDGLQDLMTKLLKQLTDKGQS